MPNVPQGRSRSGKKKTRCTKSAGSNVFELSPVTPHSRAELAIVLEIIQDVQGRKTKLTLKEYEATARRYNAAVFQLFAQGSSTAAAEVRYAPTTASLLQKYLQQERGAASRMRQESALAHAASSRQRASAIRMASRARSGVRVAMDGLCAMALFESVFVECAPAGAARVAFARREGFGFLTRLLAGDNARGPTLPGAPAAHANTPQLPIGTP